MKEIECLEGQVVREFFCLAKDFKEIKRNAAEEILLICKKKYRPEVVGNILSILDISYWLSLIDIKNVSMISQHRLQN